MSADNRTPAPFVEGVGFPCDAHDVEWTMLCRYPGAGISQCHHCGKALPHDDDEPSFRVTMCGEECARAFNAEHPREAALWIPIEETMPGRRYDGVWENSGLDLGGSHG
jgi:hypothetical protein